MIHARRTLAVLTVPLLLAALLATLVVHRVSATVMRPEFYKEQARELDIYNLVHDEILPNELNEYLQEQNERLPENLGDVELPTDARSQQVLLDLLREAAPPEYLQQQAEAVIDQFVPWITGNSNSFEVNISFFGPLDAITRHATGEPSQLEAAWREIELSKIVLGSVVASHSNRLSEEDGAPSHRASRTRPSRRRASTRPRSARGSRTSCSA
jgi:hypothetical protein